MLEFIIGLFIDLSLLSGIILLALSFTHKFKKHRQKMLVSGAILIIVGIIFFDTAAVSEAYQKGREAGEMMIHD